jgi:uncharacterized protein
MVHPALIAADHRPWPLPNRPWAMTMDWEELLFLHWRVPVAALRPHLPASVQIDTFDGSAWLGVVPFRMANTRLRGLPAMPGAGNFPELNVRTYVRVAGRPGVWFFSLDAASRLAVLGARATFGLPYLNARMHCERGGEVVRYESVRTDRRAPPARFAASWQRVGAAMAAVSNTLEHFLAERYCLFVASRNGAVKCGEIAHAPWQLAPARVDLGECSMTRLLGFALDTEPVSALVAEPVRVAAWWLQRWS